MTIYPLRPNKTKYEYRIHNHKCYSLEEVAEYIKSTKGLIQGRFYRSKINEIKINGVKIKRLQIVTSSKKGITMTNDELTINQKLWLCMTITDKCPYCNETIVIRPEDMGANLRSGNYMCRCPKCDKVIEIIISTSFQKREQQ